MAGRKGEHVDSKPASELRPYLRLMRLWGLWPYGPGGGRATTAAHWLYVRCSMLCQLVISAQQLMQMTTNQDLNTISSTVDVASLTLAALYRQALFTFYVDDFKRIVYKVDANFLPHRMPHRVEFDIRRWLKRSKMYTFVYLSLPVLIVVVWVTSRNIDNIKIVEALENASTGTPPQFVANLSVAEQNAPNVTSTYEQSEVNRDLFVKRRLPVNCWYPFDTAVSPAFEIAFVWETSMALYCGMVYVVSDLLLFMVIYLICGQLEILNTSLRLLRKDYEDWLKPTVVRSLSEMRKRESAMSVKMDRAIVKCVDYHCDIIELIGDLDRMLRTMIVVDFLHAVVSLSFAMLQTIIANSFYEWIQMLVFIGVCVLHQFLNNLFAEVLIQQQEAAAEAAYEAPWVEGSGSLSRTAVLMTTAQARVPTKLSGWKMYVLGNSTFVDFMKLLSSYFLVLQSLHAKEVQGQA